MADYTKLNTQAGRRGHGGEVRLLARHGGALRADAVGLGNPGVSYFRLAPEFRQPFGHTHAEQEEVYVVLSGSARLKAGEDIVELTRFDAVRVPGATPRGLEAGPEGVEILAVGAPNTDNKDAEMLPEFWPKEN